MGDVLFTIYVLVWPAGVLAVLGVMIRSVYKEWARARKEGKSLI